MIFVATIIISKSARNFAGDSGKFLRSLIRPVLVGGQVRRQEAERRAVPNSHGYGNAALIPQGIAAKSSSNGMGPNIGNQR